MYFFNLYLKKCTFDDVFLSWSLSKIRIFSYKVTALSIIVNISVKKVDVMRILLYSIKLDENKVLANNISTAWKNSKI